MAEENIVSKDIIITGMHCEACERTIKRALHKLDGFVNIDLNYKNKNAKVVFDQRKITLGRILNVIAKKGYEAKYVERNVHENELDNEDSREADEEESNYSFVLKAKRFIQFLLYKDGNYSAEREMINIGASTFLTLLFLEGVAYFGFFYSVENFFSKYAPYIFYLIISVVTNGVVIWHIKAYQRNASCMSGMMIGMTTGMMSGFMFGAIVGATNGMFYGSIYGILIGILVGVWCGKCCGIMGIMEGLMAGLMAGLMGAMTSVMMLNDNLQIFMPFLIFICSVILIGLTYMVYKESKEEDIELEIKEGYNLLSFITISFIVTIITTFFMIYGPKSIIVR